MTNDSASNTMFDGIVLIIRLAIPMMVIQIGSVFPSFITVSYIGRHYGSLYVNAYSLARSVGNTCVLTIIEGVYRALESLLPQSFGAKNYHEVEYVSIRAIIVCTIILVPTVSILAIFMNQILVGLFGENMEASQIATSWYRLYCLSLPFHVLFNVTSKFLAAQHIMIPEAVTALSTVVLVLPTLLNLFGPMGFEKGTSSAIIVSEVFQSVSLLMYVWLKRPYHPETWVGLKKSSVTAAMNPERFQYFVKLSASSVLTSASWVYWEVLALLIGKLGIQALSIHAIAMQTIAVLIVIPLGTGIAMTIRIGNLLPVSWKQAKKLCFISYVIFLTVFACISALIHGNSAWIYNIFTSDQEIIEGCRLIWGNVAWFYFNFCIFCLHMSVSTALCKQGLFGCISIFFMIILGIPLTYYNAIINGGGLTVAWTTIWMPMVVINLLMFGVVIMTDWEEVASTVCDRENMNDLCKPVLLNNSNECNRKNVYYGAISSKDVVVERFIPSSDIM